MAIGAVVVERGHDGTGNEPRVVAVAGDARFRGLFPGDTAERGEIFHNQGNVMAHAVLRVIAMVAEKRLALEEPKDLVNSPANPQDPAAFLSSPLTSLETKFASTLNNLSPGGYLCLDLELYLTHEPCVMCAMAILHSRFGRVVYGQSMPMTGALSAELGTPGYGLFWREQLNWKYLCWHWEREKGECGWEMKLDKSVQA